ncbi:hypothetical protein DFP72DRAFT_847782 [Ephemerocybe angulata]|uniref:Aldehyde dehydrogenase domain-containing protein n=1 Tax=Ephemerocybe angulata TaxID=980116 RepID=A0A8H6HZN4_9AGAR|nr:hypothetical protein DFP72DRAFT_847782 [Tulosesus angulatus]
MHAPADPRLPLLHIPRLSFALLLSTPPPRHRSRLPLPQPSEVVPTFSKHLSELVPKYLDHAAYHVALGGAPEITKILELKWAHIFYTGNARIARVVSAAAAKHLTPMTLELGGKSPVIIEGANLGEEELVVAARRVVYGRLVMLGRWFWDGDIGLALGMQALGCCGILVWPCTVRYDITARDWLAWFHRISRVPSSLTSGAPTILLRSFVCPLVHPFTLSPIAQSVGDA